MRTTLIAWMALVPIAAFAQTPPAIQWQHVYGGSGTEVGYSIISTSDGGYIATSTTQSDDGDVSGHHGSIDVWVTKLDADGAIEWERCYGGSDGDMYINLIEEAPGGGYLVGSTTFSNDGDVTCPDTGARIWLVRLDPSGEVLWDLCPAGPATNTIGAITATPDGDWLVCGNTWADEGDGCGLGQTDLWVARISAEGSLLWSRCHGGSYRDEANHIFPTSDGGYIMAGSTRSNDGDLAGLNPYWVPPAPASTGWILQVDAEGTIQWQHCYGGSWNDSFTRVQEAADGGYWVLGTTQSNDGDVTGHHGDQDGWVLRLAANGELLTQRCIGGSGGDWIYGLCLLSNGSALVAGYTFSSDGDVTGPKGLSDAWALELDHELNIVWERSYGGTSYERWMDVQATSDGGAVLIGNTWSDDGDLVDHPGNGEGDTWVLKLAPWSGTNVEESVTAVFDLFPNPTTGDLQIHFGPLQGPGWQLEIVDALGRVMHAMPNVHATQGRLALSTNGLAQGTYALRLHRNGESHVKRFIKQ